MRQLTWQSPVTRPLVLVACFLLFALAVGLPGCGDDSDGGGTEGGEKKADVAPRPSGEKSDAAVETLIDQAIARVKAGDSKGAIELLSQVIGNDPNNARAFAIRADIYAARKQDANALADFGSAIRIEPETPKWRNARGFFLFTRGKRDAALRDLNAAITLDGKYAEALNNRGLVHVGGQEYQLAIKDFDEAIRADAKYADAWNNRGFAHFRSDQHAKALADFNQALACDKKFIMAYNNRALLRMARKEYREAVADCTQAIGLDSDNPRFYQLRREAYRRMGKAKEALADGEMMIWLITYQRLSQQIARAPRGADGYILRARHLAEQGRTGAALADYQRAIAVEPAKAVDAYIDRARHWISQKQWQKALEDCQSALKSGATHEAWSLRGEAYKGLEMWDEAISDFVKARRFDDVVAATYAARAEVHKKAGRTAEAEADTKRAVELDPTAFGSGKPSVP